MNYKNAYTQHNTIQHSTATVNVYTYKSAFFVVAYAFALRWLRCEKKTVNK